MYQKEHIVYVLIALGKCIYIVDSLGKGIKRVYHLASFAHLQRLSPADTKWAYNMKAIYSYRNY